jgi:hypothetical protein
MKFIVNTPFDLSMIPFNPQDILILAGMPKKEKGYAFDEPEIRLIEKYDCQLCFYKSTDIRPVSPEYYLFRKDEQKLRFLIRSNFISYCRG